MQPIPSITSWIWDGEKFTPCDHVPIADRGFRFGMSIFESLRVLRGEAQFLDAHITRLRQACFHREFAFDHRALERAGDTLRKAGTDGFARIYVTGGDGAPGSPATGCRVFLFLEHRERPAETTYDVMIAEDIHHPLFGGLKTANYWGNVEALHRSLQRGKNEALLFNERAELVSSALANVFIVSGSRVRTPSTACGARVGVVREWVRQRLQVEEGSIFVSDVLTADEIFLTNSWIGIMPIAKCDDRLLPSQSVAQKLAAEFPE